MLKKNTMDHIDTYLWWNRSPNCRILIFACFTNSSSQSLIFCGTPPWCEMTYFKRALTYFKKSTEKLYVYPLTVTYYLIAYYLL